MVFVNITTTFVSGEFFGRAYQLGPFWKSNPKCIGYQDAEGSRAAVEKMHKRKVKVIVI